ncbi:MAG TPA: site-specific integrase [Candidatus Limnocylindrales bacterium]|nr:site-specific integrase [Candidatus Limnocylindrales bacterium]
MAGSVSGHVYRFEGKRRPVWRAKYRLPDGRQVKKTLGPAWTARGRPPAGYYTRRTAETWLRLTLAKAADGTLPGMVSTGVAVADACAGYLRYIEQDRSRKPSTLRDYASIFRNHVLPHLGDLRLEDLTPDRVERWAATEIDPNRRMANRTREKTITVFHGVMERALKLYRLPVNPVADVEKPRTASRTEIQVFSPGEVMALVRAAADAQDAAIYLTAAFTGMRQGELLALRWRDVDFPGSAIRVRMSYTNGHLTSPKSGKVRSVPMAPKVAETLARVGQRELFADEDDLVFLGITGGHLDGSELSRGARARRAASAALPRPPAYVRHARHWCRRHTAGPGVDGTRERPDDDAVPPLRAAARGCRTRWRSVRSRLERSSKPARR